MISMAIPRMIKLSIKRPNSHLQAPMRSDNHINVGRMAEFPLVTWACKYALVLGPLAIGRVRVIYHLTHFCPRWS